jgi:hypothetical protein
MLKSISTYLIGLAFVSFFGPCTSAQQRDRAFFPLILSKNSWCDYGPSSIAYAWIKNKIEKVWLTG